MKWLQWLPLIATLGLIYLLRRWHIGVTDFKVFVFIIIGWSLFLILFYHRMRPDRDRSQGCGDTLEADLSSEE